MRKKILIVLSVMFVFGLFASAFALSGTSSAGGQTAASCCPLPEHRPASLFIHTRITSSLFYDSTCSSLRPAYSSRHRRRF